MEKLCVQVFFKKLNTYMHTDIKRTLTKGRTVQIVVTSNVSVFEHIQTFLQTFNFANCTSNLKVFITRAIYSGLFKYR